MAKVFPFQPYRYTPSAGPLENLVTQPYDKISPEMRERYLGLSPYNLVRIILGKKSGTDSDGDNIYTRAAAHLNDWIGSGILSRETEPSFYAYFQQFTDPDSGALCVRKGFIGVCQLEEYSAAVVHRHEQTLSGPKKDRREVLSHTQAHFGQIFMLYRDPEQAVDRILDEASQSAPLGTVTDDYRVVHTLWKISEPAMAAKIQQLMDDKKLIIADGHHRYETALGYSKESPKSDAQRVMMTFVNMNASGLRILATHRLVRGLDGFSPEALLAKLKAIGQVETFPTRDAFKAAFSTPDPGKIRIGVTFPGDKSIQHLELHQVELDRPTGGLDVNFLHERILDGALGISVEAVREEKYLKYIRGIDAACELVANNQAQVGFLLQPTTVEQVAEVSFGFGVMPQKSTDFYPKLLSGLTIYRLEK
ncbi:MAG: DUF1015 domain-containing protein [Acidobacteriia bacterium]|nr:DUF1015 domain-containing protein [Terriglobia bacterium]